MTEPRPVRTVDVEGNLYEELRRRAREDRRTLKDYVNLVLERHCDQRATMVLEKTTAVGPATLIKPLARCVACGHRAENHKDGKCNWADCKCAGFR